MSAAEADVIVLDWRLPDISGIDLLPELRRHGVNLPVVFLTSHAQLANEKLAFERGALDFIDKTRGVEFLAKRLRLVSKHCKPAANPKAATQGRQAQGRQAHRARQARSQELRQGSGDECREHRLVLRG